MGLVVQGRPFRLVTYERTTSVLVDSVGSRPEALSGHAVLRAESAISNCPAQYSTMIGS
jgi:hypothetical protein